MPLYMDIHTVDADDFSAEDVVKAHMEDLAIQDKFGVKQIKYWVNENAKTIFCLMTGPNKEACHKVHEQSHGGTACNIIEVEDDEYKLFMGQGTEVNDLAKTDDGHLDTGYRSLLLVNVICLINNDINYVNTTQELIKKHNGQIALEPNNQIMASFVYSTNAISCAAEIKNFFDSSKEEIEYNLAIVSGKPVDEEGDVFFEETKAKINSLCSIGFNKRMYLDNETIVLSEKELLVEKENKNIFTLITNNDFEFSLNLSNVVNQHLTDTNFNSEELISIIGLSKSQASRKIKALTGMTPNNLIQETRLQKALNNMTDSTKTISEVAYASGFNSPTYFTRVFKKRFGIAPTAFTKS